MKRSTSPVLALVLLTLVFSADAAPVPGTAGRSSVARIDNNTCNGRPCIQVGTFNLYSMGSNVRSGQGLRTQSDVQRLVDLVAELGIEVVVFQEINTSLSIEENGVVENSTQQWNWLKRSLKKAGYRTVTGISGWDHRMVIAYHKKSVHLKKSQTLLVSQTFDLGDGCSATNQRMPKAVTLEAGEFLFMIVGLSLKERGDAPACSAKVRTEQVDQLLNAIESQLTGAPDQIFFVGDFGAKAKDKSKSTLVFEPATAGAEFANFIADYSDHVPVLTSLYTDVP